jgi:hypothetical protein
MTARDCDRRNRVIDVARNDDADRDLSVIRCVTGIERSAAGIEADLAFDRSFEVRLQPLDVYDIPWRRAARLKRLAARNLRPLWSPLNVCQLHREDGLIMTRKRYTTSRILFSITVLMISHRSFVPFANDSAKASACLVVILPGMGGSF